MLLTLPFWVGRAVLVVMWALRDFGRGLPSHELQYSTLIDRYVLGLTSYGGAAFALYFIVFGVASGLYRALTFG